jgi:methyl-accepting chemotaxis protein
MAGPGQQSTTEQLGEDIGKQLKIDAKDLLASSDALAEYANQVNSFFTQGRQRITELSTAIADAVPDVRRLGGDIGDVADIMGKVAAESRRNVIANTEDVEKLICCTIKF